MKKFIILLMVILGCLSFAGCGDSDSAGISWNEPYWYPSEEDDPYYSSYSPYIGIADFGKSKLIMLDRNSVDNGSPWSFDIPLNTSPKTVAYSHFDRMMYVGCGSYIDIIYPYLNYFKISTKTDDTVFLASDFYSTIFGGWEGSEDFTFFTTDIEGYIHRYKNIWVGGTPVHSAVSPYGYYAAVSGTGDDKRTVTIYDRENNNSYSCPSSGNRGLDVFEDGTVCAVCQEINGTFSLNMISSTGVLIKTVTLSGMTNPWGVACVDYSDGSSEVFVTDCSNAGKICVFDGLNLTESGTILGTGMFTKHISRTPDTYTLYAVNQGDGTGKGASLVVIDPSKDFSDMITGIVNLGGDGVILEGLSVMPYYEDWR